MMLTTDCRRKLQCIAVMFVACCAPSLANAGVLKLHGDADFLGRDDIGNTVPLGSGPIILKLDIDDPAQPPDPNAPPGIEGFGGPFNHYHFEAPTFGIETSGGTMFNSMVVDRMGGDFDSIQGNVPDCVNAHCNIPAGTIGNSAQLAPAMLFFQIVQPEGTLPESFSSIHALADQLTRINLNGSNSMISAMYNSQGGGGGGSGGQPAAQGGGSGGPTPEITSLTILGHLTSARIIPEPSTATIGILAALMLAAGRRLSGRRRTFQ